jgi:hypothetical protein
MPILGTSASGYFEPVYELSQTFNASGTFTVPAGKTKIAIAGTAPGAGGGGGLTYANPGGGGGGGGAFVIHNISTSAGTNYTVTIGAAGNGGFGNTFTNAKGTSGGNIAFGNRATKSNRRSWRRCWSTKFK